MRSGLLRFASMSAAAAGLAACATASTPVPRTILTERYGAPARPMRRVEVGSDVSQLLRTLSRAYPSPALWADNLFRYSAALTGATRADTDSHQLCDDLGAVLTQLGTPSIFVTAGPDGTRCLRLEDALSGGMPRRAYDAALPQPSDAGPLVTLAVDDANVALLTVRGFASPGEPAWGAQAETITRAARAAALVLDLRAARGDDPSALLPLVRALTGRERLEPLARIRQSNLSQIEDMRALARRLGERDDRDAATWQALVGSSTPQGVPSASPSRSPSPSPIVTVLVGHGCEEACEVVARMLATYASATVVGGASSERRATFGSPGVFVLSGSGIHVHVPTTIYEWSDDVATATGALEWTLRDGGASSELDAATLAHDDILSRSLANAREHADARRHAEALRATPPLPCASYPPVDAPGALPADAARRLSLGIGWDSPLPRRIVVRIDLPLSDATAYVRGCPGLRASSFTSDDATSGLLVETPSFAALSRLLQSAAVRSVRIEHAPPSTPD